MQQREMIYFFSFHFQNLPLALSFDPLSEEEQNWPQGQKVVLTFDLEDKISWAIDLRNSSLVYDVEQIKAQEFQNLTIHGTVIGFNQLKVT